MSIEAQRLGTGLTFHHGADGGMYTGSIAKLEILETLLLQHQDAGTPMSDEQRELATRMIENSENAAADDLYEQVGEGAGLHRAAARLGVRNTVPGDGILWGFTRSCARDFVALLNNLVGRRVLAAASQAFVLGLMSHVEAGQDWGVSAAADPDTTVRLKNGWLPSDRDGGRWLVNSVGVITVSGHKILIAVLTQHGADFDDGIELVEKIARISARVVAAD